MKWLIVSTIGKNPGDEFIRCGIEAVIKSVDPTATGYVIDKEQPHIFTPQEFDKCIWGGMPVFWCLDRNNSWSVPWWKVLSQGWVSANKNNFCILGAGSFQDQANPLRGVDTTRMKAEMDNLIARSHTIVARDSVVNTIADSNIPVAICPAIIATNGHVKTREIKGCNLMPQGGHYATFNPTEAAAWRHKQQGIADALRSNGFIFYAHNREEERHAIALGWKPDDIITYTGDLKAFIGAYRNVDKFFGNRIHGCIVARGNNADVVSCGYDSRQEAVKLTGAITVMPSQITADHVNEWAKTYNSSPQLDVSAVYEYYQNTLIDFMKA